MIAVISELWPNAGKEDEYFALSLALRPSLEAIDGFISAERFKCATEPGKYLSFSLWRDEASLSEWRNLEEHRLIMAKGRNGVLRDYRIRVAHVLYDYSLIERTHVPEDSRRWFGI
jgi:heme-degrading monooxygenase HmoA